ncbi:F-box only protein 38 [Mactra antiquata]
MPSSRNNSLTLMTLPLEVLCHILKFLSLRKVLQIECVSRRMQAAVLVHLRNLTEIDFKEDAPSKEMFSFTVYNMSDCMFNSLLDKLPNLKFVYGFHPAKIIVTDVCIDHLISKFDLTTAGVCHTLDEHNVIGIEINSLDLLDSICMSPIKVEVIGKFKSSLKSLALFKTIELNKRSLKITHLHLTDCTVASLVNMDEYLEQIYLRNVRFTDNDPFINASMRNLKSFSMSRCMGPFLPVKYVPLVQALANAHQLHRLDIQDIRHLGGTIGLVCAGEGFQESFCRLESILLGNNKHLQIEDIVNLVMRSADILSSLKLQPSLTKDSVFQALKSSGVTMNADFKELYLGWKDDIDQTRGEETSIDHRSSHITDNGMRIVGECFPTVRKLDIRNSPYLKDPRSWFTPGCQYLKSIEELCICNCWSIELKNFTKFLTLLPDLKSLTLQDMLQISTEGSYDDTFRFHMDRDETYTLSNGTYYIKPQGGALNGGNCLMPPYGSISNHPVTRPSCENITGNQESQHLANQNHSSCSNYLTNENASFNHGNDSSSNENGHKLHLSIKLSNQKNFSSSNHNGKQKAVQNFGDKPLTDESRDRKHIHMRNKLSILLNSSSSNQLTNQNDSFNHENEFSANEGRENTHMSIQLSSHNAPSSLDQLVNGSAALNHGKHSSANRSRRRKHMSIKLTNQREDNKLRDKEAKDKYQNCGKKHLPTYITEETLRIFDDTDYSFNSTSPQYCSHNSSSPQYCSHNSTSPQYCSHNSTSPQCCSHNSTSPQYCSHNSTSPQCCSHNSTSPQYCSHNSTSPQYCSHNSTSPQYCSHNSTSPQYCSHNSTSPQYCSHNSTSPQCCSHNSTSPQCCSHNSTSPQYCSHNSTSPQYGSHNSPYAISPSPEGWSDASECDKKCRPKKRIGKSPSFEISTPERCRSEDWSCNKNSNKSKKGRKRKYIELGSNDPVGSVSPERCSCCPGLYEKPTVSKRGKSIITKNGVVSKSKSSKRKKSTRKKTEIQNVCTCNKQYKDSGSQTTIEDITQIYQRCYLGDISMSSVTMETDRIIKPGVFKPGVDTCMKVTLSRKCKTHKQSKDRRHIGCSSDIPIIDTNDPMLKYQCFSPAPLVLQLSNNSLESVTLHDVNIAELHISCNKLVNLSGNC